MNRRRNRPQPQPTQPRRRWRLQATNGVETQEWAALGFSDAVRLYRHLLGPMYLVQSADAPFMTLQHTTEDGEWVDAYDETTGEDLTQKMRQTFINDHLPELENKFTALRASELLLAEEVCRT